MQIRHQVISAVHFSLQTANVLILPPSCCQGHSIPFLPAHLLCLQLLPLILLCTLQIVQLRAIVAQPARRLAAAAAGLAAGGSGGGGGARLALLLPLSSRLALGFLLGPPLGLALLQLGLRAGGEK